ncbi:vacuolar protein sorting-associated protein 51-like [Citrus sinensis]|uniref:Vacuolar protein sorting-associated protein 51-like n=1 Tax=Citrus sinensis TaxID=2711 RepID=A0ACB8MMB8_CITSI|nr:vacuolar protein sorting-associated protein 51-like [Citrus sinensis]
MAVDDVPLDDKAKRMRDLLSSFYAPDPSMPNESSGKYVPLDAIDTNSFDADQYMNLLVQKSSLEGLLQRHVEMAAEIKNLDTDLQMLVYENYSKFISATDTIKRMNSNIVGMEANMEQLLEKIKSVQSRSDGVNTSLSEKREHIEKLHCKRNLLRKVQFIYDLPARLGKCIESEAYADAVRFYTGALPIFKAYGDSSFQDCKRASEEAIAIVIKNLQGKLFSDSESTHARAEAAVLLKQLDFPVDSLKAKLLEKLEQSLGDLQLKDEDLSNCLLKSNDPSKQEKTTELVPSTIHEASVREFVEAVQAYRVIFPDAEKQLIRLVQDLVTKNFETAEQYGKKRISSADLLGVLRMIWKDVLLMDEVLHEAVLSEFSLEAAQITVKHYVASQFSLLLHDISDALTKVYVGQKEGMEECPLQVALEASKKAVLQGSMDVLLFQNGQFTSSISHSIFQEFRQLLDDKIGVLVKLKDLIIDWVQEGFQEFFRALDNRFLLLSGRNNSSSPVQGLEGTQGDKVLVGLVLEIAASFSGGGVRGYENGPAFVPGEICRIFRSSGEKLLHHYINMRNQKISILLRKRLTTPNWVKHKEPREVHMFVDLFLQELRAIADEVKQILPQGLQRRHRRTDSNGSTTSSRSNPLREDKLSRSTTQKARSQLLETHLAKLFKQKVEIFTKVEYTQESVITTIVKLSLKSLQEFVRLQTYNRSGFQQIQLDVQYLRTPLKETVEDEAAIDFLLDEVIVAAAERCLDPIPLEPPILDKLIQAKLAKTRDLNAVELVILVGRRVLVERVWVHPLSVGETGGGVDLEGEMHPMGLGNLRTGRGVKYVFVWRSLVVSLTKAFVQDRKSLTAAGASFSTMVLGRTIQVMSRHQMYHNTSSVVSLDGSRVRPVRNIFSGWKVEKGKDSVTSREVMSVVIHIWDEVSDVIDDAEKLLDLPFGKLLIWKVEQLLGNITELTAGDVHHWSGGRIWEFNILRWASVSMRPIAGMGLWNFEGQIWSLMESIGTVVSRDSNC